MFVRITLSSGTKGPMTRSQCPGHNPQRPINASPHTLRTNDVKVITIPQTP